MYKKILSAFLIFSCNILFSQIQKNIDLAGKREPCFQKSMDLLGQKYIDWSCGDEKRVIDCNEKLESTPGSNLVFVRSSGRLFTGTCSTCHENSLIERTVNFKGGRVNGADTTYYISGCPQVVRQHIEGVENGIWTFFNDTSGLKAWEINYVDGIKNGTSIFYKQTKTGTEKLNHTVNDKEYTFEYNTYKNDTLRIENFSNGILDGVKKEYYWPGSILKLKVNYKQGIFDGTFLEYNKEGNLLQERNYKKGEKEGEWKFYYDNGNLLRTESWNKNLKNGEFKTFFIDGNIESVEVYKKEIKDGIFIENFPNNQLKRKAVYKKGKLIEEHIYNKDGEEIKNLGDEHSKSMQQTDDDLPSVKGKKKKKKIKEK